MRGFPKKRALTFGVVVALALLAAACSNGSTDSSPSSKTFGVNATGTVHFWARQATDGPAKALVAAFNASHKNLKVVLHLTPPNDDTSQLATAIRAGSVPDVVGLNDIDVPTFSHEHALMDITKYVNALPYKSLAQPGPPEARHDQRAVLRPALPGRPVGALVQQEAVQGGRAQPERPADRLRADRGRLREDQRPGSRHLRLLLRRQLPGLPGLHHAALAVGGWRTHDQRPARHPDGQRRQRHTAEDDAGRLPHHVGQARDARWPTRPRTA